jgi:hypothetical protein
VGGGFHSNGKTVAIMPATKESIDQSPDHV